MSFIYYLIFTLLVITSFLEFSKGEKTSKQWYKIIVVIMMLTAGLGYGLSPDWIAYFRAFRDIDIIDWNDLKRYSDYQSMEIGYIVFNKIYNDIGFGFGMLSLTLVIISLYLKSLTIYKYTGLPALALFMYAIPTFMFEEHVHIRQGMACAITLYSIKYIIDKKLLKFILCIVIAYQFHESCIVFILAYWIVRVKFNQLLMGWIVTVAILGNYLGLTSIIEVIMEFMPFGQEKFADYQSDLDTESAIAVGDIVKVLTTMSIIIYNKYAEHDKLYCMFRNLLLMGIVLYFFLGKGIFGIRLPGYYLVFLGLTVSRLVYIFSGDQLKRNLLYYSFVFYTIFLIFWFQYKQGHKSNFANYKTFFSNESIYGIWKN
ncbi:EpsG family protein [Faecalibacter rhinopitheci]|uniref:EpsG family protein n=1 Tax=Faecalibacter rhinopitheci TaxID=2779678 RepID=A0A8J7KAG4_9FLAO|nr:EpsG family protein [Faecalibacter rhinopitheci]MBF0597460.1 EpsG family protein [Faecalibacter rhinopitheci]